MLQNLYGRTGAAGKHFRSENSSRFVPPLCQIAELGDSGGASTTWRTIRVASIFSLVQGGRSTAGGQVCGVWFRSFRHGRNQLWFSGTLLQQRAVVVVCRTAKSDYARTWWLCVKSQAAESYGHRGAARCGFWGCGGLFLRCCASTWVCVPLLRIREL